MYFKLPLGKHIISSIEATGNSLTFEPDDLITFQADSSGVYYIGDITVKWERYNAFWEKDHFPVQNYGLKFEPVKRRRGLDTMYVVPLQIADNFEKTANIILKYLHRSQIY